MALAAPRPVTTFQDLDSRPVALRGPERQVATPIQQVREELQRLPTKRREQASKSLEILLRNDVFTRAAYQAPVVIHQVISELGDESVTPRARDDLRALRRNLDEYMVVLDVLKVSLPIPLSGDSLHSKIGPELNREALVLSHDPVRATLPLLHLVEEPGVIPAQTIDVIRLQSHLAGQGMGRSWILKPQLEDLLRQLYKIAPESSNEEIKYTLHELASLITPIAGEGC